MTHHIVVIGAGYAGLAAAKRTARLVRGVDATVTLINATDHFVERIRLHQVAAGQSIRRHPLRTLLGGAPVRLVVSRVTGIDPVARRVITDAGTVAYHTLVYALGSTVDLSSVPGAAEHALSVADEPAALRVQERLAALRDGGTVTVVGGGLTGIETAAEVATAHPWLRVRLITSGDLGGWLSSSGRQHLRRWFRAAGVEVRERTQVREVVQGKLTTDAGAIATDETVWAAGFRVPEIAAAAGFVTDHHGRMLVDATLRSVSHPDVYAVGDAAATTTTPDGAPSRMSCQTALPMGFAVARSIACRVTGQRPPTSRLRYVVTNISLGRRDGVVQPTHADDTPRQWALTGPTAARVKDLICQGTVIALRRC